MGQTAVAPGLADLVTLDHLREGAASHGDARSEPIRVLIAHPHALGRAGLRALLEAGPGIGVDGEAVNAEDALALARRSQPDVVLLDIGPPALDAAWRIVAEPNLADVRVLILNARDAGQPVPTRRRIGVDAYLDKDSEPTELRNAVRRLAARDRAQLMALTGRATADTSNNRG
jgi:DNA-binding NarL/FixJ family response regulator